MLYKLHSFTLHVITSLIGGTHDDLNLTLTFKWMQFVSLNGLQLILILISSYTTCASYFVIILSVTFDWRCVSSDCVHNTLFYVAVSFVLLCFYSLVQKITRQFWNPILHSCLINMFVKSCCYETSVGSRTIGNAASLRPW